MRTTLPSNKKFGFFFSFIFLILTIYFYFTSKTSLTLTFLLLFFLFLILSIFFSHKLKILNWSINVKWSNGVEEDLTDCDDDTASAVDTWLTEIEDEKNKQASEQKG